MLEDEVYLIYGGSLVASVCIVSIIIFISRRRRKVNALTVIGNKIIASPKRKLIQRKVDNSEWINKLLSSVLAKETQSAAAYLRLWLSALSESAVKTVIDLILKCI